MTATIPTDSQIIASIDIEAYTMACELDSPGSPDFDDLYNKFYDEMIEKALAEGLIDEASLEAF